MSHLASDGRLAAQVAERLGQRHPVFAAATVTPSDVTVAVQGTEVGADFEIASISKGLTGLLYVDALARGEVTGDTTLDRLLPLDGVPAGRVTLASLSTHRSGLPGLPRSAQPVRRTLALVRNGTNPYGEDLDQLLDQARGVAVGKPRPRYSNFGFELLGHALASAAGTTYASLLRDRLAVPLDLACLSVPASPDQLRAESLRGRSRWGAPRDPWTGEALGPAGGVRACIQDMARLASALLDGSAPGIGALEPVAPLGRGARIGAGWVVTAMGPRDLTWHNGGSGGFRSWLGLDRAAGTAAVVLSATSASVDRHGFALLTELGPPPTG